VLLLASLLLLLPVLLKSPGDPLEHVSSCSALDPAAAVLLLSSLLRLLHPPRQQLPLLLLLLFLHQPPPSPLLLQRLSLVLQWLLLLLLLLLGAPVDCRVPPQHLRPDHSQLLSWWEPCGSSLCGMQPGW
jgi:hypothetical protein